MIRYYNALSAQDRKVLCSAINLTLERVETRGFDCDKSGKRFSHEMRYDDRKYGLANSSVRARSNSGYAILSSTAQRIRLDIHPDLRWGKQPAVRIEERHPVDVPRLIPETQSVLMMLRRWKAIAEFDPGSELRRQWRAAWLEAAEIAGAFAFAEGGDAKTLGAPSLTLPSRYEPALIMSCMKMARKEGVQPAAIMAKLVAEGSDLLAHISETCPQCQVHSRWITDAKNDGHRIIYHLSGRISTILPFPGSSVEALRSMAKCTTSSTTPIQQEANRP